LVVKGNLGDFTFPVEQLDISFGYDVSFQVIEIKGNDMDIITVKKMNSESIVDVISDSINRPALLNDIVSTTVTENKRITSEDWLQDVRHIAFDISQSKTFPLLLYTPGDVACIYPLNSDVWVHRFAALIPDVSKLLLIQDISFENIWLSIRKSPQGKIRNSRISDIECTLASLLTSYLDICAIPQQSFFELLANISTNEEESDKLREISSSSGINLYFDYCVREKRNFVEILEDFKSARPCLCQLLEVIPIIRPRQYSIASSPNVNPSEVIFYNFTLISCVYLIYSICGILKIRYISALLSPHLKRGMVD